MHHRHVVVSGTLASLMALTIATPAPPVAAKDLVTCFGAVPTIEGMPGRRVRGTEAADVVATNGALWVETLGGDDLVCATGDPDNFVNIYAGPGDDRVDTTLAGNGAWIDLGVGADEVIGGAGSEFVRTGPSYGDDYQQDVVSTGAKRDTVQSGNSDLVDLGSGADKLELWGPAPQVPIVGGPGRDTLIFNGHGRRITPWHLDNRAERLVRDRAIVARWHSFSNFQGTLPGRLTFVGSKAPESLALRVRPQWSFSVQMGGGSDRVELFGGSAGSVLNAGGGRDTLTAHLDVWGFHTTTLLDLATGTFVESYRDNHTSMRAARFEDALVDPYGPVTVKGTHGSNRIAAFGHRNTVDGSVTFIGRDGDDELIGARFDDTLVGGAGHDTADGMGRTDRCDAEVPLQCEDATLTHHAGMPLPETSLPILPNGR